jgi:hypothetical protein
MTVEIMLLVPEQIAFDGQNGPAADEMFVAAK